jgi:hypothetical protein
MNKAYYVHQHNKVFLIDYVLYITQLLTMNSLHRPWLSHFTGRGTLGEYIWKEMERSFYFEDYSLPEGDSYASKKALIIEIFFGRDPHLWISCPTTNPRFPCSHDTISLGLRRQEALVLIPHIPFLRIPPNVCVCMYMLKRIRHPILNLNLVAVTRIWARVRNRSSNPKWTQIAIRRTHCNKVSSIHILTNTK